MGERISDKDLEDLEGLLRRATPAPWRSQEGAHYLATHYSVRDANDWTIVTDESGDGSDTAAIAALRNAAESLIAEVREARKLLGRMGAAAMEVHGMHKCRYMEPLWENYTGLPCVACIEAARRLALQAEGMDSPEWGYRPK